MLIIITLLDVKYFTTLFVERLGYFPVGTATLLVLLTTLCFHHPTVSAKALCFYLLFIIVYIMYSRDMIIQAHMG